MAACAMLAALRPRMQLKLHVNAALNVGVTKEKGGRFFFPVGSLWQDACCERGPLQAYRGRV